MIYAVIVYYDLGPKLGLVVRKRLALLGIESLEARWSSSYKSISEVKGYLDWNCNGVFSFGSAGSWWTRVDSYTGEVMLGRNISVLCSYRSYRGEEYTQGRAQALR